MKRKRLREIVREHRGSGIVYTATVRAAKEVHGWLLEDGIAAEQYHSKLALKQREAIQTKFMSDESKIIVATKAFGMGVDKPNVRFVVHYQFPDSLESYFQEAGRAGRDGDEAKAFLLYRLEDKRVQSFFLGGKYPSDEENKRIYSIFRSPEFRFHETGASVAELAEKSGISERRIKIILAHFTGAKLLTKKNRKLFLRGELPTLEFWNSCVSDYQDRHQSDREKLEMMMKYGQTTACRTGFLSEYFGDKRDADSCDHCDNCLAQDQRTIPVKLPEKMQMPMALTFGQNEIANLP